MTASTGSTENDESSTIPASGDRDRHVGAGRSTALKALEDLGGGRQPAAFTVVEPAIAREWWRPRAVIGVDARTRDFGGSIIEQWGVDHEKDLHVRLLF